MVEHESPFDSLRDGQPDGVEDRCGKCGHVLYHGFARCWNPGCGVIRKEFAGYERFLLDHDETCIMSGAPTDVMVPGKGPVWATGALPLLQKARPRYLDIGGAVVVCLRDVVPVMQNFQWQEEFARELAELSGQGTARRIVMDFGGECMILWAVFKGSLIHLHRRLEEAGGVLVLCHLEPTTLQQLRIGKLDTYFRIAATLEVALELH